MRISVFRWLLAAAPMTMSAQTPPPVRPIGRLLAASTEPLASVSRVRALGGGRVLVSDLVGRRVLLFDSTFQHATVIVDTTSGYAGLIAYRGDSTLCVTPMSLSMLMIDPDGKIARTMAMPEPLNLTVFLGGPAGIPGLDARGRLVYAPVPIRPLGSPRAGSPPLADSAPIVRLDLKSRARDTVAKFGLPPARYKLQTFRVGSRTNSELRRALDPVPLTDDWAILSDGTIAVIHGREYRVDMIDANGTVAPGPKLPFEWQRLTDDDKTAIIDSMKTALAQRDSAATAKRATVVASRPTAVTTEYPIVSVDEMPDYRPAFEQGAARGDADGNLWVRTSKFVNGGAVYDVIDRHGVLIDRVQLPQGRVIAGFGPGGMVYMGMLDGTTARVERARIR